MKTKISSLLLMSIGIILMLTPFGVSMTFAPGPDEYVTNQYSYLSLMPVGYGNVLPIMTLILSVSVLLLLFKDLHSETVQSFIQICLSICIVATALSWLIFNAISIIGIMVLGIHITVLILQIAETRPNIVDESDFTQEEQTNGLNK